MPQKWDKDGNPVKEEKDSTPYPVQMWDKDGNPVRDRFAELDERSDKGIAHGMVQNVKDTYKGMKGLFAPPSSPEEFAASAGQYGPLSLAAQRIGKGMYQSEEKALGQVGTLASTGNMPRARVTAMSMVNPFAVGPVTRINDLVSEGKLDEATGSGLTDLISLGIGYLLGDTGLTKGPATLPSREAATNRLYYATGAESGEMMPKKLPMIESDIVDYIRKNNPRLKDINDVSDVLKNITKAKNAEVDAGMAQLRGQQFFPTETVNDLIALKREYQGMMRSEANTKAIARIQQEIDEFRNQVVMDYDQARKELQKRIDDSRTFSSKTNPARTGVDDAIEKIVHDSMGRSIDRGLERVTGKPFDYWQRLRKSQADFIDVRDFVNGRAKALEAQYRSKKGAPAFSRIKPHVYMTPMDPLLPHAHISGFQSAFDSGAKIGPVNKAVSRINAPSRTAQAVKGAALGLPAGKATPFPGPPSSDDEDE